MQSGAAAPEEASPAPPPNRVLLAVVIGLGIAILIVLALIVGLTLNRVFYGSKSKSTVVQTTAQTTAQTVDGRVELAIDATVAETRLEGGYLIVRTSAPLGDEILVFDPTKAVLISRIRLTRKLSK